MRLRRWSSLFRVATAGVVLTLVLAPPSNAQPTSGVEANQTFCGGDAGGCLLPFPSSDYLQADPSSATGVRVVIPPGAIPSQLTDQLGAGGTFKDAFDGADGFSPLAPIVFQVPGDIDPASVPADGGDLIGVWNCRTDRLGEPRSTPRFFSLFKQPRRIAQHHLGVAANSVRVWWPLFRGNSAWPEDSIRGNRGWQCTTVHAGTGRAFPNIES